MTTFWVGFDGTTITHPASSTVLTRLRVMSELKLTDQCVPSHASS
jgi:hypothetical protein